VAARLEHQRPAEAVETLTRETAFLEDRRAGERVNPARNNAKRLALGVRVNGRDLAPVDLRVQFSIWSIPLVSREAVD
jgi:hypothetical protein